MFDVCGNSFVIRCLDHRYESRVSRNLAGCSPRPWLQRCERHVRLDGAATGSDPTWSPRLSDEAKSTAIMRLDLTRFLLIYVVIARILLLGGGTSCPIGRRNRLRARIHLITHQLSIAAPRFCPYPTLSSMSVAPVSENGVWATDLIGAFLVVLLDVPRAYRSADVSEKYGCSRPRPQDIPHDQDALAKRKRQR